MYDVTQFCKPVIGKGVTYERSAIQGPIIGGPFSLIDTEGRLVTEKNLLGNWVLLYFGYTSSPDVGPAELRKMANAINILGSTLLLWLKLNNIYISKFYHWNVWLDWKIRIEAEYQGLTHIRHHWPSAWHPLTSSRLYSRWEFLDQILLTIVIYVFNMH